MTPTWWDRLWCALGVHGPVWCGNESSLRSQRTNPFERTCGVCDSVWHGGQVYGRDIRTLGDWVKVRK